MGLSSNNKKGRANEIMFILVDSNEQATNPKVVKKIQKIFPNLEITSLAFGDMNIVLDDGNILAIERKRAGDFLGSIADGRLFRQVQKMSDGSKWCCIIIEGIFEFSENDMVVIDGEETNWKGASVRGAMMAVQWAGCPIIFTLENNFADTVLDIVQFVSKPDTHWQSLGRKKIISFPPITLKEEIISAFPGVGLKRAKSLFAFIELQDKNHESTLAEALGWISMFPMISPKSRPEGWGDKTVLNFITALGLEEGYVIDIGKYEEFKKKGKNKK